MLTNQGLNQIATLISNSLSIGAVGTDSTTPTTGDTDLGSPITETKIAFDSITVSDNLITTVYVLPVNLANGNNISEYGVYLNDGSNDNLVSRFIYSPITKNDQIEVIFKAEYLVNRKWAYL